MEYEIYDEPSGDYQMGEPLDGHHRERNPSRSNVDPREHAEENDRAEHIPDQED